MRGWWRDYVRLAGWFPGLAASGVVLSCVAALLEGAGLAALIPALSAALPGAEPPALPLLPWLKFEVFSSAVGPVVVFVTLASVGALARFLSETVLLRVRTEVERRAREIMGEALMRVSWPVFLSMRLGDISKAQVMEGLQMGAGTQAYLQFLGALFASFAYLAVAFSISVRMTLYTVAFGFVGAGLYVLVGRWARRHADALSSIVSSIGERVSEVFFALKFIRATGLTLEADREASGLYETWRRSYFISQLYAIGTRHAFEMMGLAFIAVFLAIALSGQEKGVAAALVFLGVFYRLAPRLLTVQDSLFQSRTYHSWFITWEERRKLAESAVEPPSGSKPPQLTRELEVRDLSYRYPTGQCDALANVSLAVPIGHAVGIIGPSGSGKSTLLDMLTGLLVPSSGSVLLDGIPLADVALQQWRRRIGLVQQDTPILHGSISQNIAWGEGAPDMARVRDAAAIAGALDFIEALPENFDTVVGERGGRLSGGQRQRLALARALYRQPDLLILDEPTSALDSESEAAVRAALEKIKGKCTMLIVAHRLDTVRFCNRIVGMDGGRVVEDGDWSTLSAKPDSVLSRMLSAQQW